MAANILGRIFRLGRNLITRGLGGGSGIAPPSPVYVDVEVKPVAMDGNIVQLCAMDGNISVGARMDGTITVDARTFS